MRVEWLLPGVEDGEKEETLVKGYKLSVANSGDLASDYSQQHGVICLKVVKRVDLNCSYHKNKPKKR